jgi:hypothetical protein
MCPTFVSDKGFVAIYPMQHQRDYFLALRQFAKEVGVPEVLVCDPHPTQTQQKVKEFCTQIGTTLRILEARTQWANRAELYVGLIQEATQKDMRATGSPLVLLGLLHEAESTDLSDHCQKAVSVKWNKPAYDDFWNGCRHLEPMPIWLVRMGLF